MELFALWFIVWILSPLVLIPLCISIGKRKSKLEGFLRELLRNGRITNHEYYNLRSEVTRTVSDVVKKVQPSSVSKDVVSTAADKAMDILKDIPSIASPVSNVMSAPETKGIASASVLFGIGVAFVILAGFIFSTAIWVYLSEWARTGIIALAGLLFFGISALAHKKFKLENTSNAFYMLGSMFSVISFVTAGIFGLFGDWFSTYGEGGFIFFAFASFVLAGFSAFGAKLYRKGIFTYVSLFSVLTGITLIFGQFCNEYEAFSLSISIFAAAATASYYYFKKYTGSEIYAPVTHALIAMRVVYALISLPHLVSGIFEWNTPSFILCMIYLAELTIYGLMKKSRLMLSFQSLFTIAVSFEICGQLSENVVGDNSAQFIFSIAIIGIAFLYRCCKSLYTPFAEKFFISSAFVNSYLLLDYAAVPYGILSMLAVEALVFVSALDMRNLFNRLYRVLLPIPFVCIGFGLSNKLFRIIDDFENAWVWIVCTVLFTAVAYGCEFMLKGDRRFSSIKYSFEFFAGLALVYSVICCCSEAGLICAIVLGIILFAEIHTSNRNIHALLPLYATFSAISEFISVTVSDYGSAGDTSIFVSIILCAVLTLISRIVYANNIHNTSEGKSHWDIFTAGILMCVFIANHISSLFSYDARVFIILTELAVFAGNLFRKGHSRFFNSWAATASTALFLLALINRPFMLIDDDVISAKITILIIAIFGFAVKKIWHRNEKFAERFSSGIYMLSYAMLLLDALMNETMFNTLVVLCTSLAILMYAFMTKKKRWFTVSAAGLTGLTLYITKDFLAEIDWWVYLLLAGILLISIAAANEYFKGKGEEVKAKAGRFFEDWEW